MSDDLFEKNFIPYFAPMLCDKERNILYKQAIDDAIMFFMRKYERWPRVLDVGAGTGMLSIFAAEAGAASVVGIEANAFRAKLAEKNISTLNHGRKIKIVNCRSTDFTCEQPFDIVVCELMGALVNGEAMNFFIADLVKRKLVKTFEKDEIYCVPSRVTMWLQKYTCKETDNGLKTLRRELVKQSRGQFEKCCNYGIFPHIDSLERVESRDLIIDQPTHKPLLQNSTEMSVNDGEYLVAEWSCCLFGQIYIENSVASASRLSAHQYSIRMRNLNFRAFSPLKPTVVQITVTDDDLLIKKSRKRKVIQI